MKKIIMLFAIVLGGLLASCEGPEGPQGPTGGYDYANIFEYRLNFDRNLNNTSATNAVNHPLKVYSGDIMLVYVMRETDKNNNPIWEPLPKRYFVANQGNQYELEYTYNFGLNDFQIVADADGPLRLFNGNGGNDLGVLHDMIFRVVYIGGNNPVFKTLSGDTVSEAKPLSYEEAVAKYNLKDVPVVKM